MHHEEHEDHEEVAELCGYPVRATPFMCLHAEDMSRVPSVDHRPCLPALYLQLFQQKRTTS
jgi:hypothetical protein